MTEAEARAILERALAHATADSTEAMLSGYAEASTRFANNAITQNVAKTNARLTVRSAFENRVGTVTVNSFDDDRLRDAVRRAEEIARQAAPDTEHMPPVEPTAYAQVVAWDEAAAAATAEDRAAVVRAGIEAAEGAGLTAAGSYATDSGLEAVANSRGLFACHRSTSARYTVTAIGPDSTGWAESAGWRLADVDAASATRRAIDKAAAARAPQEVEPGPFTVILEPAAAAEMLAFLAWTLDAKAAAEGRSAFSGKEGTRIADSRVTLATHPADMECPGAPFFGDGAAAPDVTWIGDGVVRELARTRYWAARTGRPFTGRPTNLLMLGGDASVDDLVASTEDGILVTRFWYIRFVDPMKLLLTGMTRDGLYRVRGGKVVGGVRNMRFNESPLRMLANLEAVGRPRTVGGHMPARVPPLRVGSFAFTSGTAF
ncbi:MAG: TldD/PmbA family protein [Chthonomonadales bacterium]|nr:TldD/PmbA family protein [Chthonomonadales bacterium]